MYYYTIAHTGGVFYYFFGTRLVGAAGDCVTTLKNEGFQDSISISL